MRFIFKVIIFQFLYENQSYSNEIFCTKIICKEVSIIEYLFGFHDSKIIFSLTLILLTYNIIRAYITYKANNFKEIEDITGYYPILRIEDQGFIKKHLNISNQYEHLIFLDKVLMLMLWIVIASLFYRFYTLLNITILIPS